MRYMLLIFLFCFGCAGTAIAKKDYSHLEKPQETFRFAQEAVSKDDPAAFYYCLDKRTQKIISLEDLILGWTLAGGFFHVVLAAKIENIEMPAPEKIFRGNPNTAKVTIKSQGVKAHILMHREDEKWFILYPSPYPMPDISKFKMLKRLPWRTDSYSFYEVEPRDWILEVQKKERKYRKEKVRYPKFRTE